jgi:hypothetical protein
LVRIAVLTLGARLPVMLVMTDLTRMAEPLMP